MLEEHNHRATGVTYDPDTERRSSYLPTVLPCRYDASLYPDGTRALGLLHAPWAGEAGDPRRSPPGSGRRG